MHIFIVHMAENEQSLYALCASYTLQLLPLITGPAHPCKV